MAKIIECRKIDPTSACNYVARGGNEEVVIENAVEHAQLHGVYNHHSPDLRDRIKANIHDE